MPKTNVFACPSCGASLSVDIRAGHLIGAIKIYREVFGVTLADAKTAVEALAAGQTVTVRQPGMSIPTILKVAQTPPPMAGQVMPPAMAGQVPSMVSPVVPVVVSPANVRRSLGCSLALTLGIIVFKFAIVGVVLSATLGPLAGLGLSLPSGLGQLTNQYAHFEINP